ncbi:hypothetical protein ASD54_12310 [Rhizobium sp. Root149]|uniref:hypothetical protein n=1 Tax=Rhizobium sp. Root149 TaxID=1736473 RepID=UPI0007154ECE|nr:hypothetical protein [Rhizobium sp. Root149]KQZ49715.1 hypothetical protein ASD54_12310 [Rhizobium sp. Root149]
MPEITWESQSGYAHSNQVSNMLRESLRPKAKFRQFATLDDGEGGSGAQPNAGDTFYWNVYNTPPRQNFRLAETQRIQSSTMTKQQRSLTVTEMGRAIEHTQKATLLSKEQWEAVIQSGLSFMAASQFDVETFNAMKQTPLRATPTGGTSTTSVTIVTDSTPTITNNVELGTGHIKAIVDYMKTQNIPPHRDSDTYYCITDVRNLRSFKNELENIHKYTDTGLAFIKYGEVGKYEDTIFIEQTMIPRGGALDSTTYDPYTNTSDEWNNAKASWAMFFGDDPVTEAAIVPEEVRARATLH